MAATHEEFEIQKPADRAAEVRDRHPMASVMAQELKALFGDDVKITYMQDGDVVSTTSLHRLHAGFTEISVAQYEAMGRMSAENALYVLREVK